MRCSIDKCESPTIARGWCTKHYQRWQRHGSADWAPPTAENRLLAKTLVTPGKCWIWQGDRAGADDAYGIISVDGRSKYVHRFAYELWIGPIPDGYEVDHVRARGCSSTVCINPQHLEAVTPVENRRRSESVSEVNKSKTHCIHGHEFTPANTVLTRRGHRRCRSCAQAAEARKTGNPEWQAREAAYRRELRARRRRAAKAGRV